MSFSLSIVNPPAGSVWWYATFNLGNDQSGWLAVSNPWNYPGDPGGAHDLSISVYDSGYSMIHSKSNLGPIYNGKSYAYNCSTGVLSEVGGGAAPNLISPANHSEVFMGPCAFQWSAVAGATDYLLKIWIIFGGEEAFVFNGWVGNATSRTIELTGTGGPVYWSVTAYPGGVSATWDFTVVEEAPVDARIVSKKLSYGGVDYDFGVTVPLDTAASVKISGRNDSADARLLKMQWTVKRPTGADQQYLGLQSNYVFPGGIYTWEGPAIVFNLAGAWTIIANLTVWNGEEWVAVDSFGGTLCSVGGVATHNFQNLVVVYSKL